MEASSTIAHSLDRTSLQERKRAESTSLQWGCASVSTWLVEHCSTAGFDPFSTQLELSLMSLPAQLVAFRLAWDLLESLLP